MKIRRLRTPLRQRQRRRPLNSRDASSSKRGRASCLQTRGAQPSQWATAQLEYHSASGCICTPPGRLRAYLDAASHNKRNGPAQSQVRGHCICLVGGVHDAVPTPSRAALCFSGCPLVLSGSAAYSKTMYPVPQPLSLKQCMV